MSIKPTPLDQRTAPPETAAIWDIAAPQFAVWQQTNQWLKWILVFSVLLIMFALFLVGAPSLASTSAPPWLSYLIGGFLAVFGLVAAGVIVFKPRAIETLFELVGSIFSFVGASALALIQPVAGPLGGMCRRVGLARVAAKVADRNVPRVPLRDYETEALFPETVFTTLWAADVPSDLKLPVVWDGLLPGGIRTTWLARRAVSRDLVIAALVRAAGAALIVLALGLAVVIYKSSGSIHFESRRDQLIQIQHKINVYQSKMESEPSFFAPALRTEIDAEMIRAQKIRDAGHTQTNHDPLLLIVLFSFGFAGVIFVSSTRAAVGGAVKQAASRYLTTTKDAVVRYRFRIDQHKTVFETYSKQIFQATGRLRHLPLFNVGTATGRLRIAGSLITPAAGTPMMMDGESIFQHVLITGGTGEGKTRELLLPLVKQILVSETPKFGLLGMDAKGVLYRDIVLAADLAGRADDVVVIGTEPGQSAVDLAAALDPSGLAYVIRAIMTQAGGSEGGGNGSFFRDTAAIVVRHAAIIAQAEGAYTISRIWKIAIDVDESRQLIERLKPRLAHDYALAGSVNFYLNYWLDLVKETRDGVVATLATVLDPITTDPAFKAFAMGDGENLVDLRAALEGKIVLCAISATASGVAGKLSLMVIKSGFMRAARLREQAFGTERAQAQPVILMVDEAQELATASTDGLSDATFFNLARSAGVAGIYVTQSEKALHVSMGVDPAKNLVQQFRTQIYMRTEDPDTIEAMAALAGNHLRSHTYEAGHYESVEVWEAVNASPYWRPAAADQSAALDSLNATSGLALRTSGISGTWRDATEFRKSPLWNPIRLPSMGLAMDESQALAQAQWVYSESVRQDELLRNWLHEGHDTRPAISEVDVATWGRFHAFAYVQRAGGVRMDIIELDHHQ